MVVPVILATWEAQIGRTVVWSQLGQKARETYLTKYERYDSKPVIQLQKAYIEDSCSKASPKQKQKTLYEK
jgi:hypothetical protein